MSVSPPAVVVAFLMVSIGIVSTSNGRLGRCATRDDVASRVGVLSGQLQELASQGKIALTKLASATRGINEAETSFGELQNFKAHCLALDAIGAELNADSQAP